MPFDPDRVRAVLFDVDGTLSDSDGLWTERMERWLRPMRFLFPQQNVQPAARRIILGLEAPGNAAYHLLDHYGLDALAVHLIRRMQPVWRTSPPVYRIQAGVESLLERLAGVYPLAVVSAREEESTLGFLNHFNLLRFFGCVATAQTCRYTKPFPDPLLWAAAKLGVPPESCLMVGDTAVDIHAGRAAGAQSAGVLCGFGRESGLRRAGADLILAETGGLSSILPPVAPNKESDSAVPTPSAPVSAG